MGKFLETGLGTYLQEKFGDKDKLAYPSLGRDLHRETSRMAADFGRFIPFDDAERQRNFSTRLIRPRRFAHLQEGSFVRYLIESKGLTKFLRFYDGASVEKVYAADLPTLERAWQQMIRSLNVQALPLDNVN
jgi:hypothetical protein